MKSIRNVNILFLTLISIYVLIYAIQGISGKGLPLTVNESLLFSQAIVLIPTLIYLVATKTKITELIPFRRISIPTLLRIVLFTYLTMPLITLINAISMLFSTNRVSEIAVLMEENPFWLNVVLMAVIPAVSEEFIFRGVFYHTYRKKNVLQGALGCGVVFGLMHMNFNQFSYALVLGLIFALLVEATGSILAPMAAHFIINNNSVLMMELLSKTEGLQKYFEDIVKESGQASGMTADFSSKEFMYSILVFAVIATFATALAAAVYAWIAKTCNTEERVGNILKAGFSGGTIVSIPFAAAAAISIAFMVIAEMM